MSDEIPINISDEARRAADAERDEEAASKFTVKDRRWWARGGSTGDAGDAEQPSADANAEPEKPSYVAKLEAELADRDQKLTDTLNRQRAALAELERARGRIERDAERQVELARRDMVRGFLDIVDDIDRAIEAAKSDTHVDGALLEGVELVKRRFLAKLGDLGVLPDDPIGEAFDPTHHEAVSMVPVADPTQNGKIIAVIKTGYSIGTEVLRPAMVAVGRA